MKVGRLRALVQCDRCKGPMDRFDDPPICPHGKACMIAFCWRCPRFAWRGPCAVELAREIVASSPHETTFELYPPACEKEGDHSRAGDLF